MTPILITGPLLPHSPHLPRLGLPRPSFPFPPILFRMAGKVLGQSDVVDRLLDSLAIDSGKRRRVLSWNPPYSLQEGLKDL